MTPAQKKVVLRRFSAGLAWGYLPQRGFLREKEVAVMGVDGRVISYDINDIKTISYVRDFNLDDAFDPERVGRRSFSGRPRSDGLWLKVTFRDDDTLEGLAASDIGFADALLEDCGVFLTPPDPRSNTQRIFAPRSAMRSLDVLGLITAPSKRLVAERASQVSVDPQTNLFDE